MYKIIGGDGREYGPVSADQLRQWITEGRASAQTQILPEGATTWQSLGSLPEFAGFAVSGIGVTSPPPATATVDINGLAASDYQPDIGSSVSSAWEVLKNNLGILIGGSLSCTD
ncbi:MAG: DUF4339 domain-containing protein [Verrucomicrobiota bacterium]